MESDLTLIGRVLASRSRAAMLESLLDGRERSAGDLAVVAGVRAPAATEHLALCVRAGLLHSERRGKSRYFRLAGSQVASALEALALVSPVVPVRKLRDGLQRDAMKLARTCYDHLAGAAGVAVHDSILRRRWLLGTQGEYELTAVGTTALRRLGVDAAHARSQHRRFAYGCLDWSEHSPHLAGALGASLTASLLRLGWFSRRGSGRELLITAVGIHGMKAEFGVAEHLWHGLVDPTD